MKINRFINQSPIYSLYHAQCQILEPLQRQLSSHDVHFLQGLILTAIFFEEREVRPLELQKVFGVEASNLSHSLRGLEKRGFLKRSIHPQDARGYLFSLTPNGKKKTLTLIKEFDGIQDKIEQLLGVKKTKDIVDGILQLISSFSH